MFGVNTMPECQESNQNKIKIVIADDHPLIRYSLKSILDSAKEFQVVGEAGDGEEAVRLANTLKPDVMVLDISMPGMNGLEATRRIKHECPEVAILILTVHSDNQHLIGILKAGADGYLTKKVFDKEVVEAIRGLAAGESVLSRELLKQILSDVSKEPPKTVDPGGREALSTREHMVLKMVAQGRSNKEIACQLNLSTRTIKGYVGSLFDKLGIESRTGAAVAALRLGIIDINDLD